MDATLKLQAEHMINETSDLYEQLRKIEQAPTPYETRLISVGRLLKRILEDVT